MRLHLIGARSAIVRADRRRLRDSVSGMMSFGNSCLINRPEKSARTSLAHFSVRRNKGVFFYH